MEPTREGKLKQLLITEFGASADHAEEVCTQIAAQFLDGKFNGKLPVPTAASLLYKDRHNRTHSNDSLEFLKEHYGPWLGVGGGLYQHTLRAIDPALMSALSNAFRGRRDELVLILPTRARDTDKRLMESLGYVPEGRDRKIALTALSSGQRRFTRPEP